MGDEGRRWCFFCIVWGFCPVLVVIYHVFVLILILRIKDAFLSVLSSSTRNFIFI